MSTARRACTWALGLALMLEPALAAVSFDLAGYRQRAATDRAAGIAEGRAALDAQVFHGDPVSERTLLWYMGGAAIGQPDDVALGEVVLRLEALAETHADPVADSYAGFLRGARLIDQGRHGEGLAEVLRAANPLADHEDVAQRIVAASELCRGYVNADRPGQALPHCQRHTRMVSATGDPVALARAEYMEAGVLSRDGQPALAIPLWERARDRFAAAGLDVLAGRTAGSLAGDLGAVGRHDEALEMAQQALAAAEAGGNAISVSIARGRVAEALLGLGQPDRAREQMDAAIAGMEGINHYGVLEQLLRTQLRVLEAIEGESPRVQDLRLQIAALSAAPLDETDVDLIAGLEQRFVQREQELRIRELEFENRRRELALEHSRSQTERQEKLVRDQRVILSLSVFAGLALLGGLIAVYWLLRGQRRLAARLHAQAYEDALTGLPNRRAIYERCQALLAEPGAAARGHALLMVDVDHFKDVNDRGGHPFGDEVLVRIGRSLQGHAPDDGMVARLGGEEFLVLCPGVGEARARECAEALRRDVAGLDFRLGAERLPVTISLGLAVFDGAASQDLSSWLSQADRAVYRAKQGGRDRVAL